MRFDGSAPVHHRILARIHAHPGGCWIWAVGKSNGYGRLFHQGQTRSAHRLAYEAWVGPIPDGLEIDHLCRVKSCVKPCHLEPVTHTENMRRVVWEPRNFDAIEQALLEARGAVLTAEFKRSALTPQPVENMGINRGKREVSGGPTI